MINTLHRFIEAQSKVYDAVTRELTNGRKVTHWMWYIFPQLAGLGSSATAAYYALDGPDEAQAYLDHPLLGERLRQCTELALAHEGTSAQAIFGDIDAMKFRSSMTLFASVAGSDALYQRAIDTFFSGQADALTLELLARRT